VFVTAVAGGGAGASQRPPPRRARAHSDPESRPGRPPSTTDGNAHPEGRGSPGLRPRMRGRRVDSCLPHGKSGSPRRCLRPRKGTTRFLPGSPAPGRSPVGRRAAPRPSRCTRRPGGRGSQDRRAPRNEPRRRSRHRLRTPRQLRRGPSRGGGCVRRVGSCSPRRVGSPLGQPTTAERLSAGVPAGRGSAVRAANGRRGASGGGKTGADRGLGRKR